MNAYRETTSTEMREVYIKASSLQQEDVRADRYVDIDDLPQSSSGVLESQVSDRLYLNLALESLVMCIVAQESI